MKETTFENSYQTLAELPKKQIAKILDYYNPHFNFSVERGATSYKRYSKNELLVIATTHEIIDSLYLDRHLDILYIINK
jgi:hypothetical protein